MNQPSSPNGQNSIDLVVVSDLHLGEGVVGDPPRYSTSEDFFQDDAFVRMLQFLSARYPDPARLKLVLNGDIFDFLTVTTVPDPDTCRSLEFQVSGTETRYGLNASPAKSVFKLDMIVAGHQPFFSALAGFVGRGHSVEILRGNHDLEIYFQEVQNRLLEHLTGFQDGPTPEQARERVRFHQWFFLDPGRIYIEHGNQYEPSNSIRYPFRPLLPVRRKGDPDETLLDYPLGSLFVRYFYNRVHHIDPYTPKVISFEQYLEFARRYNFLDLLRVARDHYPFFTSALKPEATSGRSRSSEQEDAQQEERFQALRDATEPKDLYRKINDFKIHPLAASKLALANQMLRPIMRRLFWMGGVALGSLYLWLLILNLIQVTPFLVENVFAKASLLVIFSVATLVSLFWAGTYIGRRLRRQTDVTVEMCADRADKIARLTGVQFVLMGHTHVVDVRNVADGRAVYANSGTWTSVDTSWKNLITDSRRMTFLYLENGRIRVSRWNDNAQRIDDVPMFDVQIDRSRRACPPNIPFRTKGT